MWANSIISMLHHFFKAHGLRETSVHPHVDICTGQNMNRFMMYYLMWRVLTCLHEEVKITSTSWAHTSLYPTGALV